MASARSAAMHIFAPLTTEPIPNLQAIEISSSLQIPSFQIIGLPGPEVNEARERVRAAIEAAELEFPRRRVVLNLSPASIRKRGTGLDLAMALAVLAATQDPPSGPPEKIAAWGELSLDGSVRPAGQMTRALAAAWRNGVRRFFHAPGDLGPALEALELLQSAEAQLTSPPPELIPVESLREAWRVLHSGEVPPLPAPPASRGADPGTGDSQVLMTLPSLLERTVMASAAGAHHLLLLGPRGTGKSHALEWLIALQPEARAATRLQNTLLRELSQLPPGGSTDRSPVRRIGAQPRPAALVGSVSGGALKPGEFSLAHGGLLVADELPEWPRDARETLREPLERGVVSLTRVEGAFQIPAGFVLAANGNLCPCGGIPPGLPNPSAQSIPCRCSYSARKYYLNRISGPLLDRLDLVALVLPQKKAPLIAPGATAPDRLEELRSRVREARARALALWGMPAARIPAARLERILDLSPRLREGLDASLLPGQSRRSRHKILRVAMTLALCDGQTEPGLEHLAEASLHRPERIGLWAESTEARVIVRA